MQNLVKLNDIIFCHKVHLPFTDIFFSIRVPSLFFTLLFARVISLRMTSAEAANTSKDHRPCNSGFHTSISNYSAEWERENSVWASELPYTSEKLSFRGQFCGQFCGGFPGWFCALVTIAQKERENLA